MSPSLNNNTFVLIKHLKKKKKKLINFSYFNMRLTANW